MPVDRGIIDQQLLALGESANWWSLRELRDLPQVMYADERVLAIARGKIGRVRVLHRPWLITVTDRRLLCLRSGARSWRQLELDPAQITRVSMRVGPFRGRVIVSGGGHTYRILMPRDEAYGIAGALSSLSAPARAALAGFGPTRLFRRVIDHVMSLPAVAFDPGRPQLAPPQQQPPVDMSGIEKRMDLMEDYIHQLQQQVDFMEQLLRDRAALPPATPEPLKLAGETPQLPGETTK